MTKLIISVIASCNTEYYKSFINEYWYHFIKYLNRNTNTKCYLMFSNERKNYPMLEVLKTCDISNNIKIYNVDESNRVGIPGCLHKTVLNFKDIYENEEFDFVLRANLSTFFIYDRLIRFLDKLDSTKYICAGYIGGDCYVSGTGYILSRPLVKNIIDNTNKLNYSAPDDAAIYSLIRRNFKYEKIHVPFFRVIDFKKRVPFMEIFKKLYEDIIESDKYYIRVKTQNRYHFDVGFLKYLTNIYYK